MAGYFVGKALGINLDAPSKHYPRGFKSQTTQAISPIDPYFEEDPTVKEWILDHRPTAAGTLHYLTSLFPFVRWLPRYNLQWLTGDVIGGVTLGFVVVPQAMAYALLAGLPPEYGLYTSFTGAALYWLFGTSKDIAIGATAIVSLLLGRIIDKAQGELPHIGAQEISKTVTALTGLCLLGFGLLRLDWLIEFIPHIAISAFVTAAAITITLSQVPTVLGIRGINTRNPPYLVFIDTCKALPRTSGTDAAVGITALFLLQLIKWFCGRMAERQKHRARMWDTLSSIRMTFIILLYTLISYLVNRGLAAGDARFRILGSVPVGFTAVGPPSFNVDLIRIIGSELPALVIIVIIEHIAIGKSFGRINNYSIVPSQEMISSGVANLLGPFLGGYAATGSFGGTAVLSKAGVRTPLAGVFNGLILLLALYALTSVFFFIPLAALAGLIIHAVINLLTPPPMVYRYWQVNPLDVLVFFVGVFVAVFESLEIGVYSTVGLSLAILLVRLSRAQGRFLGRVAVHTQYPSGSHSPLSGTTANSAGNDDDGHHSESAAMLHPHRRTLARDVFLPLDRRDGSNRAVDVDTPHPGVFIYRFSEGYNYLNQAQYLDELVAHITSKTRKTNPNDYKRPGDRPWNEAGPIKDAAANNEKPLLRAVIFDFSAVNQIDMTAIEGLMDVRAQLDRWASPAALEWHFAGVKSRWTRRALAVAGFGFPSGVTGGVGVKGEQGCWAPAFDVAPATGAGVAATAATAAATPHRPGTSSTERSKTEEAAVASGGILEQGKEKEEDYKGPRVAAAVERMDDEERDIGLGSGTVTPGSLVRRCCDDHSPAAHGHSLNQHLRFQLGGSLGRHEKIEKDYAPLFAIDRPFFHIDLAAAVNNAVESARWRDELVSDGGVGHIPLHPLRPDPSSSSSVAPVICLAAPPAVREDVVASPAA